LGHFAGEKTELQAHRTAHLWTDSAARSGNFVRLGADFHTAVDSV
jgi:hypothetical protein